MTGPELLPTPRDRIRFAQRARVGAVLLIAFAWSASSAMACGGTTGKQETAADTGNGSNDAGDATANAGGDGGIPGEDDFDATIEYADAGRLPKIVSTEAGPGTATGDAGPLWQTWPVCPCDTTDPTTGVSVPSTAPGCSPSEVTWTRRGACDSCLRGLANGSAFPPCCDARDAGLATAGPAATQPVFDLCADLYACELSTDCYQTGSGTAQNCYCGGIASATDCVTPTAAPDGGCKDQTLAAYQVIAGSQDRGPAWLLANQANTTPSANPGYSSAEAVKELRAAITGGASTSYSLVEQGTCNWACDPTPAAAAPYVPPVRSVMVDGGVFTKTESLLYLANPSCYACLQADGCLDDDRGDINSECEDLAGQTVPAGADAGGGQKRDDLCYATLQCLLGSPSCLGEFGNNFPSGLGACGADAGGCLTQEQNGLETTDPASIAAKFNDTQTGAGIANRIFNCASSADNCASCFTP